MGTSNRQPAEQTLSLIDTVEQQKKEIEDLRTELSQIQSWMSNKYPLFSSTTVWEHYCEEKVLSQPSNN